MKDKILKVLAEERIRSGIRDIDLFDKAGVGAFHIDALTTRLERLMTDGLPSDEKEIEVNKPYYAVERNSTEIFRLVHTIVAKEIKKNLYVMTINGFHKTVVKGDFHRMYKIIEE